VKLRRGVGSVTSTAELYEVTDRAPTGALVDGARSAQRGGRWPERLPQQCSARSAWDVGTMAER
jgi:hypothetical protein